VVSGFAAAVSVTSYRLSPARAVLYGTLVVGVLDITDALVFFGLLGTTPLRLLQGIASGLLGSAAFQWGLASATLGAVLHFFIAFVVVLAYYAASTRLSGLTRRPLAYGALYGLVVYSVMYLVVLPLSRTGPPHFSVASVTDELFAHICLVGIPSALFARAAQRGAALGRA
jgi:hypothetical protein